MKYGCIAEKLGHSFSRDIHEMIGGYEYELREIAPADLDAFMKARDFLGINVTIPYKRDVIPYLYEIDDAAQKMGAVNTIVNRDGRLYGYNTDFPGMRDMIESAGIDIKNKKVLILGTGGTSHMANALARHLGARDVVRVSRTGRDGAVTYVDAYISHKDAEVIINTTPAGMYPSLIEQIPIDIERFPALEAVVDAVYNPLRTRLVQAAQKRGVKAVGGLYMLVAQAVYAAEHFTGKKYGRDTAGCIYRTLLRRKENIVLTGMPGSGKSTLGRRIAESTGRRFIDTDAVMVKRHGDIGRIFAEYGEGQFRDWESEIVEEVSKESGCVIATGGGVILRERNVDALKQTGRIYYIDRPLEWLTPTSDRPLAKNAEAIKKRYHERHDIYIATADEVIVPQSDSKAHTAKLIEERHLK